jgi:hypothetical protein
MNVLLIGACGVGKTWVMKQLIKLKGANLTYKIGMIYYHSNSLVNIIGKYDNSTFEGSDRLSMAAVKDIAAFMVRNYDKINIYEGDRFTNSTFITAASPIIVKIQGHGDEGRRLRGSQQTDRHIKSIATRVSNISAHHDVENSDEALFLILKLIEDAEKKQR